MAYDFDRIASRYDRMNRLMTFGLDRRWRKRAVKEFSIFNSQFSILDVACGTGDMCVLLAGQGCTVTGVDLSEGMLSIAKRKVEGVEWRVADAEHLPFVDATFDAVTCAFGVRNFVHLETGLKEMLRVLKPGGRLVVLELATPDSRIMKVFYDFYARRVIPRLGHWLAGSREAYSYLPASIEHFPKGEDFLRRVRDAGYGVQDCSERKMTFGVCRLYTATKQ